MDRRGLTLTAALGLGLAALLSWYATPATDLPPEPPPHAGGGVAPAIGWRSCA